MWIDSIYRTYYLLIWGLPKKSTIYYTLREQKSAVTNFRLTLLHYTLYIHVRYLFFGWFQINNVLIILTDYFHLINVTTKIMK